MGQSNYEVAVFTRGVGAFAYTYRGPAGLQVGQVVAVTFRNRFEFGVICGEDAGAAGISNIKPLLQVEMDVPGDWGRLLLDLSRLFVAGVDELVGHLLFASTSQGLRASLQVHDAAALSKQMAGLLPLAGVLTPKKRKMLMGLDWELIAEHVGRRSITLSLEVKGTPGTAVAHKAWRASFVPDRRNIQIRSLPAVSQECLPGSYLAGLVDPGDYSRWKTGQPIQGCKPAAGEQSILGWGSVAWDTDWELARRVPEVSQIQVRQCHATWEELRSVAGLAADIQGRVGDGQKCLLIVPQRWILDRLWPRFASIAGCTHRYLPDPGPGVPAHIIGQLERDECGVVAGGPSAWKLAAYVKFDSVVLVDPSHPQFAPGTYPMLDVRLALLTAMAGSGAQLDMVNMGLSCWDGSGAPAITVDKPYEGDTGAPQHNKLVDTNPLPLELRQPGTKRLVYFNRLGFSRGLKCAECSEFVGCPSCGSNRIAYSQGQGGYHCPACGFREREVRCPQCGLANLASLLPGLESVTLREGDKVVTKSQAQVSLEVGTLVGTSALLEPVSGFWPQEIVYVHADSKPALLDDWPTAIDNAARLRSLYSNPDLAEMHIVSDRLAAQLGSVSTGDDIAGQWQMEHKLRRLALLPPFGCIYKLSIAAPSKAIANTGKRLVGSFLLKHPETSMLRLGKAHMDGGSCRLGGYFVNPVVTSDELLELGWAAFKQKARLRFSALVGPWL